jgi:hypothetical protein
VETIEVGKRPSRFVFKLVREVKPAALTFKGKLRVHGATVTVDGKEQGILPATVRVPAGRHLAVVTKDGVGRWEKWLDVVEGQEVSLDVVLEPVEEPPAQASTGDIKVIVDVEGATVSLDGEVSGPAPFKRGELSPGVHLVEASAPEYATVRREVTVRAGETSVVRLSLEGAASKKAPAMVRVIADVSGAQASVDGGDSAPVPATFEIRTAGTHLISVTAPEHEKWTKQVTTSPGQKQDVVAALTPSAPAANPVDAGGEADVEDTVKHRDLPFSAQSLAVSRGTLDLLLGWPYIGEMRINAGIYKHVDVGFIFRNALDTVSEFEGRVKYRFTRTRAFGFAAEAGIGGGVGFEDRNSFIFRLLALGSVFIGEKVAFTARFGVLLFSDKLARTGDNDATTVASDTRDTGLELQAGLTVEFAVDKTWNFFLLFDGMPARTGSHTGRLIFNEGVGGDLKNEKFRAAAGATLVF